MPRISGTCGSLISVALFYFLRNWSPISLYILTFGLFLSSLIICHQAEAAFGQKDSSKITFDEIAGQMITYCFVPYSLLVLIVGFVLFRFFDIVKIWPANWAQDKLPGGLGVVMDDVFAGVQGGIVLMCLSAYV